MKNFLILISLLLVGIANIPQAIAQQKENYVYRYKAKVPLKNPNQLVAGTTTQSSKSVTYYDGLGRPKQTIQVQGSAAAWDLIQPVSYDAAGRQVRDYLPYPRNNGSQNGNFRANSLNEHAAYFRTQFSGDSHGYSETQYEFSSLGKEDRKGSPGNPWRIGSGREVILIERPNLSGEYVRKWEVNADGLPVTSDTYREGTLWVKETISENKTKTVEYADHLGNVIMRKVQISATPSAHHTGWLATYYVYDFYRDLRVVIPPKAVAFLTNNWSASTQNQLADGQYYRYRYDDRKRVIEKKMPGKGWEYTLYDEKDRVIGVQDANQREKNQWHYRLYDAYNREIVQGIVVDGRDRDEIQRHLSSMAPMDFEVGYFKGLIRNGIQNFASSTNAVPGVGFGFPMKIGEMLLLNFYDHYDFNSLGSHSRLSIIHSVKSDHVQGLQTGGLKRNLQTGKFLETTFFYDKQGLPIQQLSENHLGGTIRQSTAYNFEKKPILETSQLLGPTNLTVTKDINYFPNGALRQISHRIGLGPTTQLVNFQYSQTGELTQKRVHNSLFNLDFNYNIRGWLTQINEAKGSNRLFGMQLFYESEAAVNNWNGNISRVDWKGRDLVTRTYQYRYDLADRVTQAGYSVASKATEFNRYSVSGISYDPNGNLLRMVRNNQQAETVFWTVDNLSYEYLPNSNSVYKITDYQTNTNFMAQDFKPGSSAVPYSYDENGNLKSNGDKQIREIAYNFLNLPTVITFESGEQLTFTYAADGTKLRQEFKPTSGPSRTIDYVGEFIFEDGNLDYIIHDEGRVVVENESYHYEYYIKDHLGNVRQVIRPQITERILATMETGRANAEEKDFERIRESRQSGAEHNVTPGGNTIAWLNAARGRILGPAWEREVQEGQELLLSVYGKYRDHGNVHVSPAVFVSSGAKTRLMAQLGELSRTTSVSALPNAVTILSVVDLLIKEIQAKPSPEAYMMYALYDKKGKLYAKGKKPLSNKAAGKHEYLSENIYISKDGRMEAFLVNETAEDVWFDDFEIQNRTPLIVQESHYDPWGMQLSGLGYQYKGFKENRYLYNGKEHIADRKLAWYDYGARMYDPAVGRWWVVDPLASVYYSWSPYNYTLGNPIKNVDPDGRIVGTIVGAVVGGVTGAVDAYVNDKDLASSIAEGATAGAIAGAVVDITVATGGGAAFVFGAAIAGGALGGAVGDVVGQTTNNMLNNNQALSEALGNVDQTQVGNKAITGAVSGVVGGSLGAGTAKVLQVVDNSSKSAIASVGKNIESMAKGVMQQGTTKMTTNGVSTYSQAPGLAGKVQGVMDNMVNGMGQSGRAAANGLATTNAVAAGSTEAATKTLPVQNTVDYLKNLVFSIWVEYR